MAPIEEHYFPSLETCLSGNFKLITWKLAFDTLCDKTVAGESSWLLDFLSCRESVTLLSRAIESFPKPSSTSKSAFETWTAAINLTPASNGQYDIREIKEDALWLSREAGVDELEALRVVTLEWQNRPTCRLLAGFSDSELVTLDGVLKILNHQSSLSQVYASSGDPSHSELMSSESRRARLLHLYLEERRGLLGVFEMLISMTVGQDRSAGLSPLVKFEPLGRNLLKKAIVENSARVKTDDGLDSHIISCTDEMQTRLDSLEKGDWKEGTIISAIAWTTTYLYELIMLSDIIHLSLHSDRHIMKSSTLLPWLRMVNKYSFFTLFQPLSDDQSPLVSRLQVSAATTSVALLDPSMSVSYLVESQKLQVEQLIDQKSFYFFDRDSIGELQDIFLALARSCNRTASPAVLSWGIVLFTIRELGLGAVEYREQRALDQGLNDKDGRSSPTSSIGSTQQTIYEDVADLAKAASMGEDPVGFLTHSALEECQVFDVLADIAESSASSTVSSVALYRNLALLDIGKVSLDSIGYAEVLTPILTILEAQDAGDNSLKSSLAQTFMSDEVLMTQIFDVAKARFPYEMLPFLRVSKALAQVKPRADDGEDSIAAKLVLLDSFTQVVPSDFTGYHTTREDENTNFVSLEVPLTMGALGPLLLQNGTTEHHDRSNCVPEGATGQVVSNSRPIVIMWGHKYSGLGYLGRFLEMHQDGTASNISQVEPTDQIVMTTIQLFSRLVRAAALDHARAILEEASSGLSRNTDIMVVIYEIFERQIQNIRFRSGESSLSLATACLEFLDATVNVLPGRLWPLLSRSSFLNLGGSGSFLVGLISNEATLETCDLMHKIVQLYTTLHQDSITRAVIQGRSGALKVFRGGSTVTVSDAPDRTKAALFLAFTTAVAELYDRLSSWQTPNSKQIEIRISITQAFRRLLSDGFGLDNMGKGSELTGTISSAAKYILDFFLPEAANDTNLGTVIQTLTDGLREASLKHVEQTVQTLWFCYGLIRAAKLKDIGAFLERQLCHWIPGIIRLYRLQCRYEEPCLKLMSELIATDSMSDDKSSSLLTFLGAESSRNLLEMLSMLDGPCQTTQQKVAAWDLLTAMLTTRHQWFAIYLLTGSSPRDRLKKTKSDQVQTLGIRGKAFLAIALDELARIGSINQECAISMLAFVCRAQENWAWVNNTVQSHPSFFSGVINHVSRVQMKGTSTLTQCYHNKIASLFANLAIVYLHHARSNRDYAIIKTLYPAIKWFAANSVGDTAYNSSLHANLRNNFPAKFENCAVSKFKRSQLLPSKYGDSFFYDSEIAGQMLISNPSWRGTARGSGFAHEFKLANLNLSLVDSQLLLLRSFKALSIEHAAFFARDREVQKLLANVILIALEANAHPTSPEKLFDDLFQTRMELVCAILQSLVKNQARGSDFTTLLSAAWETTRFRNTRYDDVIANNDLEYFRSCLTSLLLCIQLHDGKNKKTSEADPSTFIHSRTQSTVLEILKFVAQGFGHVSIALNDQSQSRNPINQSEQNESSEVGLRDFSLLLSIFESTLRLPTLPEMISQISDIFISSTIIDAAVHLYSWSHRLSPPGTDPVYSSAAISFLVSLSSFPRIAEEIGLQAVLSRLSSTRISTLLQSTPGGVGPLEVPRKSNTFAHPQRLYVVWSEGLLPLCLQLLHSVGRPMASEIAAFLNQFPDQLDRASNAFAYKSALAAKNPEGAVSLSLATEAATIALISRILRIYRLAGASAGVDSFDIPDLSKYDEESNRKGLVEDIQNLLSKKIELRDRIVATSEKEAEWAVKMVKGKETGGERSLLEEKIVEQLRSAVLCLSEDGEGEES